MKRAALVLFGLSFLSACGSDPGNSVVTVPLVSGEFPRIGIAQPMQYRFYNSEGDPVCDTELHVFSGNSQPEILSNYCRALLDNRLNHNCATRQRYDEAARVCPPAPPTS